MYSIVGDQLPPIYDHILDPNEKDKPVILKSIRFIKDPTLTIVTNKIFLS